MQSAAIYLIAPGNLPKPVKTVFFNTMEELRGDLIDLQMEYTDKRTKIQIQYTKKTIKGKVRDVLEAYCGHCATYHEGIIGIKFKEGVVKEE